eukprot:1468430-Rhodomonas_salina.1
MTPAPSTEPSAPPKPAPVGRSLGHLCPPSHPLGRHAQARGRFLRPRAFSRVHQAVDMPRLEALSGCGRKPEGEIKSRSGRD